MRLTITSRDEDYEEIELPAKHEYDGERLVTVIDEEACTAEQIEQYWRCCDDDAVFAERCADERKQGY